jgi:hypothetical protein
VRQTFYRAVSTGLVAKSERAYKGVIVRLLTAMRRRGDLPYSWIADSTRWLRKPRSFVSLDDALADTVKTYRRNIWDEQEVYVEV